MLLFSVKVLISALKSRYILFLHSCSHPTFPQQPFLDNSSRPPIAYNEWFYFPYRCWPKSLNFVNISLRLLRNTLQYTDIFQNNFSILSLFITIYKRCIITLCHFAYGVKCSLPWAVFNYEGNYPLLG